MREHRWQGYTHQELYDQINQGPGADGSTDSVRRWTELTRALGEIDTGLAAALANAMAGWQGSAAENARGGLRPLGEWAVQAQQAADIMRERAEQQAEFISKARTDMPPPVSVHAEKPNAAASLLIHVFGGQSDYEAQEAEQNAAEQRAFEVMRTYEASTSANTTSLASFVPPPQVVVDAPKSAGGSTGSPGQQPITISWSTPSPAARVPSQLNAAQRWTQSMTSGRSATAPSGSSTSTGTRSGHASGGGSGSTRRNKNDRDDPEQVDRNVTEQVGSPGGFFDEPQTLSRPVIGGEPTR